MIRLLLLALLLLACVLAAGWFRRKARARPRPLPPRDWDPPISGGGQYDDDEVTGA